MPDGFYHKVRDGEWLSKIAAKYHISDWKEKIWDHPKNADLANGRSPDTLYPGERIFIPAPENKHESRAAGKQHQFVVKRATDTFHVKLLDAAGKPIQNASYQLTIGQQKFTGTTNGSGEIHEKHISRVGDHNGTLELPDAGLFYHITVGGLNPAHKAGETDGSHYDGGISGIQMRLKNLGYNPGKTDGTMSKETTDAIILFQTLVMKRPASTATGELDDETRDAIGGHYGS